MKKIAALFLIVLYTTSTYACTTFLLTSKGKHYFGRNYDFVTGTGMVMINSRNVIKNAFTTAASAAKFSWTSRYGSITFNQFGKDFPQGGMNEKGLVVELMWLDETRYPQSDARPGLTELQWIQYQLDNFSTIAEVIASDKTIRIDGARSAPLHFLIADANGSVATIEFLNEKMTIHRGKDLPFPVLTNSIYADAVAKNKSANAGQIFTDNSLQRFTTACKLIDQYKNTDEKENPVDYSFKVLNEVAQKGFTRWSIVYDIHNMKVFFLTDQQADRKSINIDKIDFSCSAKSLALKIYNDKKGDVTSQFALLDFNSNKQIISQAAEESKSLVNVSEKSINARADYFNTLKCQ